MTTNRDRIKYLRSKLSILSTAIRQDHMQEEYISLVKDLAQGERSIDPVDDALWDTMLPEEQNRHLLAYYHTQRLELLELMRELERQEKNSKEDKFKWLDDKWIARILTVRGVIELTVGIYQAGSYAGLWFDDEQHN